MAPGEVRVSSKEMQFGGQGRLPSRSNCKVPLGPPCAVTPFQDMAAIVLFDETAALGDAGEQPLGAIELLGPDFQDRYAIGGA